MVRDLANWTSRHRFLCRYRAHRFLPHPDGRPLQGALLSTAETIELRAGDLMLLAHDDGHVVGSDLEREPVDADWLNLRDRVVGKALALMHAHPERSWSIDELGVEVGMSRSALAQRFTDLVGRPPMQYLTRWRLTLAAQRLRREPTSLDRIAEHVGYESQAAFNRAFKRAFGVTPARWRREGRFD